MVSVYNQFGYIEIIILILFYMTSLRRDMKYSIDPGGDAAYLQLYKQLRRDIVTGAYPYGGKLPSKRLLAEETGVSVITAEHTLALLSEEGYIEPRERSGYYVCYTENDLFGAPESPAPSVPHGHGPVPETDFPFSVLAGAMRRVLSDYGENILQKGPNVGEEELRSAIAGYLRRSRDMQVHPEQIVIGAGAEYLYTLIVLTLGRDKIYAIEQPSYEKIEAIYAANGVSLERLPLGHDGIRTAALERSAADVLHITPYRSYPTGVTASASKRRRYLRWAERAGRYIVEDDYESEFTLSSKPEETLYALSQAENVIYMNTFSQTVAPGMRMGYLVLPGPLLSAFEANAGVLSCTVPAFEQLVMARLIEGGDFERHINRVRRKKRKNLLNLSQKMETES